ncbi:hypothetical protein MHBO_002090, partial [Bonamia ostreae]
DNPQRVRRPITRPRRLPHRSRRLKAIGNNKRPAQQSGGGRPLPRALPETQRARSWRHPRKTGASHESTRANAPTRNQRLSATSALDRGQPKDVDTSSRICRCDHNSERDLFCSRKASGCGRRKTVFVHRGQIGDGSRKSVKRIEENSGRSSAQLRRGFWWIREISSRL